MKTLVTGATGFVGANITAALVRSGHRVVGTCHSAPGMSSSAFLQMADASEIEFIEGDVRDADWVERIVAEHRPTYLVHGAGLTPSLEMELSRSRQIVETNELSVLSVLLAAQKYEVKRTIFISSAAVYAPGNEHSLLSETAPLCTSCGLYAVTKLGGERLCRWAAERFGIDVRVVRLGPVFGRYDRPTASRLSMSPAYTAVHLALSGESIRCNQPEALQDWIYGPDVGRAFNALLEVPELAHDVYNLAGEGATMQRLFECIASVVTRSNIEWVDSPAAANIPISAKAKRGMLDVSRLSTDARFVPEFTLEAGIRDYIAWLTRSV